MEGSPHPLLLRPIARAPAAFVVEDFASREECAGLAAGTGRNASLACVRSRADNEFVARDLGANKEPTWIGLTQRMDAYGEALATRDGWDQWASGCEDEVPTGAYRYTNWNPGEPNDWGGNGEDCAVTGLEESSLWYDAPCSLEDPRCLCARPATTCRRSRT